LLGLSGSLPMVKLMCRRISSAKVSQPGAGLLSGGETFFISSFLFKKLMDQVSKNRDRIFAGSCPKANSIQTAVYICRPVPGSAQPLA
jgi:hypothetical protein